MNKSRFILLITILLVGPLHAAESTDWTQRFQIHGFASQAYIKTTDNRFFGNSDKGSFDFTELGINSSFRVNSSIRLAGQLLSRRAGEFDNGSPRVDYALADINLLSTSNATLGAYLGRVKNPIGLYNETRDVAHTRAGIFLPQVIYFDKVRDLIISSDGIHLYGQFFLDNDTLLLQAGAGYPVPDKNVEYTYMGRDWDGNLRSDHLGMFGKIVYEQDGGRWIYSLTGARASINFHRGTADAIPFPYGPGLSSGEIEIDYTVLSTQYNGEKWQFTTEAAFENVNYVHISDSFADHDTNSLGYFAQLNYSFTPQWQAFVRYEEFQLDQNDWDGNKAAKKSLAQSQLLAKFGIDQAPLPAHTNFTKNWVVGAKWDINNRLMLRTEYHIVNGTATLSPRENDMATSNAHWNMFAVLLSYHF